MSILLPHINSDQQLVKAIKEGDPAAFDSLYWKFHKAVYAGILKLLKDQDVSKDILQDVFVTLWIKRDTLDPDKSIAGWLATISYHKCIDYLRKVVAKPLFAEEIENAYDPDAYDNRKEQEKKLKLIQDAIGKLSPKKRRVFELCKINGKSYKETAHELNISKHTVKEYLKDAITHIRNYIHNFTLPSS